MPVRVTIEDGFLWTIFSGDITAADLVAAGDGLEVVEAEPGPAVDRITDLRDVTSMQITFHEIMGLASRRIRRELPNDVRSAIVAPDAVVRSAAEVFLLLNRNPRITLQIFDDMEGAQSWLHAARTEPEAG